MRPVVLEKLVFAAILVVVILMTLGRLANRDASSAAVNRAKNTILGTAISPAHFPGSTPQDFEDFFDLAAAIGSHVTLITEWKDAMPLADVRHVTAAARAKGLQLHLYLSPVALYGGRKDPAVPSGIGRSFTEPAVRKAFQNRVLELASVEPDYLGLGTEVNLLAQNPTEFDAYVAMVGEAYRSVKARNSRQTVTVSFQWDVLLTQKQFDVLARFAERLDVYSFTSYPSFFKNPAAMPADYYGAVRKLLPTARVGFAEIGWHTGSGSSEDIQDRYLRRLPELMHGARPEFVTLALLHDVRVFSGELGALNSVGVRNVDGTPKKSWHTVRNLVFD